MLEEYFGGEIYNYSLIRCEDEKLLIDSFNKLYPSTRFNATFYGSIDDISKHFELGHHNISKNYIVAKIEENWYMYFNDQFFTDGCSSDVYNLNRLFGLETINLSTGKGGTMMTYYKGKNKRVIHSYIS